VKFNARFRRRLFGAVCLGAAGGMLLLGETKPPAGTDPVAFVAYWLACFGFVLFATGAAVLDLRAVRREAREVQRNFLADALREIEAEKQRRQAAPRRKGATDLKD
jgi:hypothetical protein